MHARISGVRGTKHEVFPNKRSVMAGNSFHRQCLQLEPFCKVCGAWFSENWKKIFAVTTMQPSSTFFGVNTAEDNTEWSPANICHNTLILIVAFPKNKKKYRSHTHYTNNTDVIVTWKAHHGDECKTYEFFIKQSKAQTIK